jgi:hypothetical protein
MLAACLMVFLSIVLGDVDCVSQAVQAQASAALSGV